MTPISLRLKKTIRDGGSFTRMAHETEKTENGLLIRRPTNSPIEKELPAKGDFNLWLKIIINALCFCSHFG